MQFLIHVDSNIFKFGDVCELCCHFVALGGAQLDGEVCAVHYPSQNFFLGGPGTFTLVELLLWYRVFSVMS